MNNLQTATKTRTKTIVAVALLGGAIIAALVLPNIRPARRTTPPPSPAPLDVDFLVNKTGNASFMQGSSATVDIVLGVLSGSVGSANLFAQPPAGSGWSGFIFSPSNNCNPNPTCTRTLTVGANSQVTSGRYPVVVSALAGDLSRQVTVYFCVGQLAGSPCVDDIYINFENQSMTLDRNSVMNNNVTIGTTEVSTSVPLSLSLALSPPTNVVNNVVLSQTSCVSSCTISVSAVIKNTAPAGQYTFTLRAQGGGVDKTKSFILVIP